MLPSDEFDNEITSKQNRFSAVGPSTYRIDNGTKSLSSMGGGDKWARNISENNPLTDDFIFNFQSQLSLHRLSVRPDLLGGHKFMEIY